MLLTARRTPAVLLTAAMVALALTLAASGAPSAPAPTRIAAGFAHACALTSGGVVKCWGGAAYGEVGNGGGPYAQEVPDRPTS